MWQYCAYQLSKRQSQVYNQDLSIEQILRAFPSLEERWAYCHHYFWNLAPHWLRAHRAYFRKRGFGEDAFHAMWFLIFREHTFRRALEIGVYRGQVVSLWSLLAQHFGRSLDVHGISPFSATGDGVSTYPASVNYYQDVLGSFAHFGLHAPGLHRGWSTDPEMVDIVRLASWDLIYIDGNHDYDVVKHDFAICSEAVKRDGLIVLDDAALYCGYRPSVFSSAGHPGPSRVADEIDRATFREVISVGHNRVFQRIT